MIAGSPSEKAGIVEIPLVLIVTVQAASSRVREVSLLSTEYDKLKIKDNTDSKVILIVSFIEG